MFWEIIFPTHWCLIIYKSINNLGALLITILSENEVQEMFYYSIVKPMCTTQTPAERRSGSPGCDLMWRF